MRQLEFDPILPAVITMRRPRMFFRAHQRPTGSDALGETEAAVEARGACVWEPEAAVGT